MRILNKNQKYISKFQIFLKILNFGLSFFILISAIALPGRFNNIFGGEFRALLYAQDTKEEEAFFIAKKAFEDGFYEVSQGLFERFLINYGQSLKRPEAYLYIGECYFYQQKYLKALKSFQELLNLAGSDNIKDAILYWIAEVHFKGNDFSQAKTYYQKLILDYPDSKYLSFSYYSLGWCLSEEKNFQEAKEVFDILIQKFTSETNLIENARFKVAECIYNLRNYPELKGSLESFIKDYPHAQKLAYVYFYLGEASYYLEDYPKAAEWYLKVSENSSDSKLLDLARLGIGWSCLKLKKYNEAKDAFNKINPLTKDTKVTESLLIGKGLLLSGESNFVEANNIYNELINKSTTLEGKLEGYIGKGESLYSLEKFEQAIAVYEEAKNFSERGAVSPELVGRLSYGLAWSYLKVGKFKEAIEKFQEVAKESQDKTVKISSLCQIGDAYQDAQDFTKAVEIYDNILKDYPDSFYSDYVQYQLGVTLLKMSKYDGAVFSFKSLKANFPKSKLLDKAEYYLGVSYFQKGDFLASSEQLQNFIVVFKGHQLRPDAMYLLGVSFYNQVKYKEAISVFKEILKDYSDNQELIEKVEFEIADSFYHLGDENEALKRFTSLRSKYPDSFLAPNVVWWLGEFYYKKGDLDLAKRYFQALVSDYPKSNLVTDSLYAMGSCYDEQGLYKEAREAFKKILELPDTDLKSQAIIALADILTKEGNYAEALKTYEDALNNFKELDKIIYPKIALLYQKKGEFVEAINIYRKALDIAPQEEKSYLQFQIAQALEEKGEFDKAIEEYLKVTYLYPSDVDFVVKAFLRTAKIFEDKGSWHEAKNIYEKIASMQVEEAKYAKERINWILDNIKN